MIELNKDGATAVEVTSSGAKRVRRRGGLCRRGDQ